jgi:heterodisulfide reductase subunit A
MTAALNLADQGFKVVVVERQPELGGLLRNIHSTLERDDIRSCLSRLTAKLTSNPNVTLFLQSRMSRISGQVGNFKSALDVAGRQIEVEHGVVIVATGGQERQTAMYLHGKNRSVITQSGLESILSNGELISAVQGKRNPIIAMIQCVESRNSRNPYCSRVCCSEAIKNALHIKDVLPDSLVVVLGRDVRAFGFREYFFGKAAGKGVRFIRLAGDDGPFVTEQNGRLRLQCHDAAARRDLSFTPDLVVLSTGIAAGPDNAEIAGMLRSPLTADGFFLEAHPKIRPVDLPNEGEFVCGLAHSPRFLDETIAQAQAVASRAAAILSKPQLEILGQVARVNPAKCVACATCVKVCPFGAPAINEIKKAEIRGAKCVGCGSCAAACPARTITLQHQEDHTLSAMVEELAAGGGCA